MRDEDFQEFIAEFGEATHQAQVPEEAIDQWRGRLPDQLLTYWQQEGWCGYANGRFWTVNPALYEDLIDEWLRDSPFEQIDAYHVIARSAFGELYACGEKTGPKLKILCPTNALIALAKDIRVKDAQRLDFEIRGLFGGRLQKDGDLKDESGQPLFERALQKLGPLSADEIYGFEPAVVLGGKMRLPNLSKLKIDQHLTILRQLATPTMPFSSADIEKLIPR